MNLQALANNLTSGSAGGLVAFGIAFFGGILAGFGPCVLPMLPAVFGYVTGTAQNGIEGQTISGGLFKKNILLSAIFVLGMSTTFALLGAAAGFVGHALFLGAWATYAVAGICAVIGLQMLGIISIPVDRINTFLPTRRPEKKGFIGAFFFGALFGLVASPCSTPILAAIATIAVTMGSVGKGAALLFVFGLGKGIPLLIIGLASGSLSLMKSFSRYAAMITKFGGVSLIIAAFYLVWIA